MDVPEADLKIIQLQDNRMFPTQFFLAFFFGNQSAVFIFFIFDVGFVVFHYNFRVIISFYDISRKQVMVVYDSFSAVLRKTYLYWRSHLILFVCYILKFY